MTIRFQPAFVRAYRKLSQLQREAVDDAITLFRQNAFDPRLRNHKLKGSMEGIRSFSAAYDLRLVYVEEEKGAIVIMLTVGKHADVY